MTYYEWLELNGYSDSGEILDSGAISASTSTASPDLQNAIIGHYEDFHLFLYGIIPLCFSLVITYLFLRWFSNTFLGKGD